MHLKYFTFYFFLLKNYIFYLMKKIRHTQVSPNIKRMSTHAFKILKFTVVSKNRCTLK